jgi:hypothetical protein
MGAELGAGGFGRGKRTEKHDRKEHTIYPGSGSRKEITLLLLHYCLYKSGSMECTIMVLPSFLLEEEDALLTLRLSSDQPLARAPYATLYSGVQGYNGHLGIDDTDYSPNRTR